MGDKLEVDILFAEGVLDGAGSFVVEDMDSGRRAVLLKMSVAHYPGFGDFQGLPVLQELGVDGVGDVVVEDEYILVSAER